MKAKIRMNAFALAFFVLLSYMVGQVVSSIGDMPVYDFKPYTLWDVLTVVSVLLVPFVLGYLSRVEIED